MTGSLGAETLSYSALAVKPIRLQSSDGCIYEVARVPAHVSVESLEDIQGAEVPLRFSSETLGRVLDFWERAIDSGPLNVEEPLKSAVLKDSGLPEWACEFVALPVQQVEELLWASDFLGIEVLLDVCFLWVAAQFLNTLAVRVSPRAVRHLLERRPSCLPLPAIPFAIEIMSAAKDDDALRVLVGFLGSGEWEVRAAAKAVLSRGWKRDKCGVKLVLNVLRQAVTPGVKLMAIQVLPLLACPGDGEAVAALLRLVEDADGEVQCAAAVSLAKVAESGDESVVSTLIGTTSAHPRFFHEVAHALKRVARRGHAATVSRLVELLDDKHWWSRIAAVEALAAVATQADHKVSHVLTLDAHGATVRVNALLGLLGMLNVDLVDPEDIEARASAATRCCEAVGRAL